MNDLLTTGAAALARHIRAGQVSPVEVVETHIRRIEQVNPVINALVTPLFEQARAQAREAEERIQAGDSSDLPPLYGVPVTVKDCWPVAGARFTGGSWYHRDDIADTDAPAVSKLRDAGAIILGKTNLPDMCWAAETVNPVFGRTRNPWNPHHTAGGSSGGEGAIIAAGGSPLGLGSDIAGSVRIPAAANGIVSLKPTGGRIPNAGHLPMPPSGIETWNTAGPMARRVEDLALALEVLSDTPVQDYRQISLAGRRASVYIYNWANPPVRPAVAQAVRQAADALRAAGMVAANNPRLPMLQAVFAYFGLFETEGANRAFSEALGGGSPFSMLQEMRRPKDDRRISPEVMGHVATMLISGRLTRLLGFGSQRRLEAIRQRFLSLMEPGGVILCPCLVTPPPRHGWTWWLPLSVPYTFLFNALGFPAVCVPAGFTKNRLPLAVQVAAQPGEDEVALAVAAELERAFGGWQIAPTV